MYRFNVDKFIHMVLFFYENTDKEKLAKTKILKLLFYTDFLHVREFGRSITGDIYYHLPFGPTPTMAKDLLDVISCKHNNDTENKQETIDRLRSAIEIKAESSTDYIKFKIIGKVNCDHSHFSQSELDIMKQVAKEFYDIGGKELSDLTHKHPAYKNTLDSEQIDYILAFVPEKDKDKQAYYEFWKKEYTELKYMLSHA